MDDAYGVSKEALIHHYIESGTGRRMTPEDTHDGLNCIVVKVHHVYRGKIIYTASYGTSEVRLVDEEETIYIDSSELFHSCTF